MKNQAYIICLGMLAFTVNAAEKESAIDQLNATCNSSVAAAQMCQERLNEAKLLGFHSVSNYVQFVTAVVSAEASGEPIANLGPITNEKVYRQGVEMRERGEVLPEKMRAEIEKLFSSRLEQKAKILGVPVNEVFSRLDNYYRYQEYLDNQSTLNMVQTIEITASSSSDFDGPRVSVTGQRLASWENNLSFEVSMLIQGAGIYFEGPGWLEVRLEVSDANVYTYQTFRYREGSGAYPTGELIVCHECPSPAAIEIW